MRTSLQITTHILAFLLFTAIFAHTCELCTYEVTPESIELYEIGGKLKDTTEAFKILDKYTNWHFNSRDDMLLHLSRELRNYPQFLKIVNNYVLESWMMREKKIKENEWLDSMVDKVWLDTASMDSLKKYMKSALRDDLYSPTIRNFLTNLQGIRFADSLLARRYALSLLAASLGICSKTSDSFAIFDSVLWSNDETKDLLRIVDYIYLPQSKHPLKKISTNKNTEKTISQSERLGRFFNLYKNRTCSDERWYRVFTRLDTLYTYLFENVVYSAMHQDGLFDDSKPIKWNGAGCGCSRKDQLNGEVIGIYPYWYAGDSTKWIDFSAITRISFYGLYANQKGILLMPSGTPALAYLGKKGFSNFVSEAHKHYVKMDWIIEKSDWSNLKDPNSLKAFFSNLTNEIDSLASKPANTFFQKVINTLSFMGDDYAYRGDGITLYFKNYPTDSLSTALFNKFFENLHSQLLSSNSSAFLNMMVNRLDLSEGIYSFANFHKIMKDDQKNLLLVVNEEPLSRSNRLLFNDLSFQLKGEDRHIVLNALTPVIWFDNRQWEQLRDDIMYFGDTYHNLGIAPYATNTDAANVCDNSGNIGTCLNINFLKDSKSINAPFFCKHPWTFLIISIIALVLSVIAVLRFKAYRKANNKSK